MNDGADWPVERVDALPAIVPAVSLNASRHRIPGEGVGDERISLIINGVPMYLLTFEAFTVR